MLILYASPQSHISVSKNSKTLPSRHKEKKKKINKRDLENFSNILHKAPVGEGKRGELRE